MNESDVEMNTIHSGRFSFTKIAKSPSSSSIGSNESQVIQHVNSIISNISFNVALDTVISKIIDDFHNPNSSLSFEFNNNVPSLVSIRDKNKFEMDFGEYVEVLNGLNYEHVRIAGEGGREGESKFDNVLRLFEGSEELNKLKRKIHEHLGGYVFYMFPPCVGYVLFQYIEMLIRFEDPHDLIHISDESLSKFIRSKLL